MYKLIPIFLFAFGFAETVEVYYHADTPIAGFQFNVDGVLVTNTSSGDAEKYNFMISANETTVVGFSLTGTTIPAGNGILLVLDVDGKKDDACLADLIISDSDGEALDTSVEDCINITTGTGTEPYCGDGECSGDEDFGSCPEDCEKLGECTSNVCMSFANFNQSAGSVDIWMDNTVDVAGYQIELDGVTLTDASGGLSEDAGFMIANSKTMVLGFSTSGAVIPPSSGNLVTLAFSDYSGFACLVDELTTFSDADAQALSLTLGDCQGVGPVESEDIINEFYNTSWAVIIGINEYENIRPLRFAVQDAKEIRKLLITEFGFPKGNVRILIDKEATLTNIKNDLYEIAHMANEEDRILVYFAGHGETRTLKNRVEKGYLIPTDGNLDKISSTCLPMTEIKDIANETVAKHILFLMDACFSGLAAVDTRGIDRSTDGYIEKIVRDHARQIITAGGKGEEVIEKDEWGHSAFAKNLIHGLKTAVADQDYNGYITADELGSFLQKRVFIDSDNQQMPLKARFGSGEGEFVFSAKKIIESAIISIVPNEWGRDRTSSIKAELLTVEDIHLLYGENEIVKKLFQEIAELKERLAQDTQFIYGCMDENAINYNSDANLDDESCIILDSDDVYIRFGDFHNLDSTLDVFMASNRRIYNLEIFTEGFEIVDVLDGNLGLDNVKTSFDLEEIYVEFSDSLDGYIIPKEETLVFKAKIMPIDETFCFRGLTINKYDTTHVKLGECKAGLMVQEVALTDTSEVEILTGEYATETGTILQKTEEGKYDILLEDSTIVEGVDPSQVNRLEEQVYSGNYLYIKNVDYRKKMIEIYYQTDNDIAGFQFEVSGIKITGASGGSAEETGFMISSSSTTVLGFSLTGSTFSGKGELLQLEYFADKTARDNDDAVAPFDCASAVASFGCGYNLGGTSISNSCPESCSFLGLSTICIESIIVSDTSGEAIDFHSGECWIP